MLSTVVYRYVLLLKIAGVRPCLLDSSSRHHLFQRMASVSTTKPTRDRTQRRALASLASVAEREPEPEGESTFLKQNDQICGARHHAKRVCLRARGFHLTSLLRVSRVQTPCSFRCFGHVFSLGSKELYPKVCCTRLFKAISANEG